MERQVKVKVGPRKASEWLATSTGNRLIRKTKVAGYKADMLAGRWKYNGDAVRFLPDGSLYDAHHRLTAVVESGVEIEVDVLTIDWDARSTVDKGAARSAADNFALELGVSPADSNTIASAARMMTIHDNTLITDWARPNANNSSAKVLTQSALDDYVIEHMDEIMSALEWVNENIKRQNTLISKGQSLALLALSSRVYGGSPVEDYMGKVLTGYDIQPGTTEDHIRSALMAAKMRQRKMVSQHKTYSMAKGLRSVMAGRSIKYASNAVFRPNIDNIPHFREGAWRTSSAA